MYQINVISFYFQLHLWPRWLSVLSSSLEKIYFSTTGELTHSFKIRLHLYTSLSINILHISTKLVRGLRLVHARQGLWVRVVERSHIVCGKRDPCGQTPYNASQPLFSLYLTTETQPPPVTRDAHNPSMLMWFCDSLTSSLLTFQMT